MKPRTCELFQTLGILEDFQKKATSIPTMRAYKLPGGTIPVKTWDLYAKTGTWPDRPFVSDLSKVETSCKLTESTVSYPLQGNGVCLSQNELEDILKKHLARYSVAVEYGKGLVGIEQTPDVITATVATFENGKETEGKELVTAQYLIGADGAKGRL